MKMDYKPLLDRPSKLLDSVREQLETIRDSVQDDYDGRSEKWQESNEGCDQADWIADLSDIFDTIEGCVNELESLAK